MGLMLPLSRDTRHQIYHGQAVPRYLVYQLWGFNLRLLKWFPALEIALSHILAILNAPWVEVIEHK
jgi:hypothetical protein